VPAVCAVAASCTAPHCGVIELRYRRPPRLRRTKTAICIASSAHGQADCRTDRHADTEDERATSTKGGSRRGLSEFMTSRGRSSSSNSAACSGKTRTVGVWYPMIGLRAAAAARDRSAGKSNDEIF